MRAIATLLRKHRPAGRLALAPLNSVSLRDQAYTLLKDAIASTDIYSEREPLRLDERELMQALGVSRTPVREALSILERSEEHTSELQSQSNLVCRLLLEKKKKTLNSAKTFNDIL